MNENPESFDYLILGSGEAAKHIAWNAGKSGKRVAVIERGMIGGSCPNVACLPSKNVIYSAEVFDLVRRAEEFGIKTGPVQLNMSGVRERKRKMVQAQIEGHLQLFRENGVELILGDGRFVGPKTIEVRLNEGGTRVLTGDHIFLNLGSRASLPDIPGLSQARPLTHVTALELDRVPEHLIVLGGGYVGLELGQAFRRFGSQVTILERKNQLLSREDPDVCEEIQNLFRDDGINILLNQEVVKVEGVSGSGVTLHARDKSGERVFQGSDILVALGREPNTRDIGLEIAKVDLDDRGFIRVNDRLETSAPDIWATGDCVGPPFFTHIGYDDFRTIWSNLNGGNRSTKGRLVPYCLFTNPPLAQVGMNERDAIKAQIDYRLVKGPITFALRTFTISETRGFMKAVIDAKTDRILGFTAFGHEAGEIMAVVEAAMIAKLPYSALRDAIFTHPTMAEGLVVLFAQKPSMHLAKDFSKAA
jgi:pyruvate/2-oxoglutarate dehydrogenase complex dihydrolipoamide dehydrogenase (E3) component